MRDYYNGRRRKDKPVAMVVVGQASESEEEDDDDDQPLAVDEGDAPKDHNKVQQNLPSEDIDHQTAVGQTIGQNVDKTKRVTDCKSSLSAVPNGVNGVGHVQQDSAVVDSGQTPQPTASGALSTSRQWLQRMSSQDSSTSSSSSHGLNRMKDSLLRSLLKESNGNLKHNLINLSCTPYALYSKDVGRITRHMIATHKHLQVACAQLHKAVNDTNQLNKSFITLSTLLSINNQLTEQPTIEPSLASQTVNKAYN